MTGYQGIKEAMAAVRDRMPTADRRTLRVLFDIHSDLFRKAWDELHADDEERV